MLWAGTVCAVIAYCFLAFFREANVDEFQSLVNAFDVWRGQRLYIEFFDNHGPLMTWLAAPLFGFWPDDHNMLYAVRLTMLITLSATSLAAFQVYRNWMFQTPHTTSIMSTPSTSSTNSYLPWLAVLLFLASPPMVAKGIEIRPDNFANLLWVASCYALTRAFYSRRKIWYVIAGLLLGGITGFTLKIATLLLVLACIWVARIVRERTIREPIAGGFLAAAGFALPSAIIVTILVVSGSFEGFLNCYLRSNLTRSFTGPWAELRRLSTTYAAWFVTSLIALIWTAWRMVRRRATWPETFAFFAAAILLFQYLFLMPTKYVQSLLTCQMPQAFLNALLLSSTFRHFNLFLASVKNKTVASSAIPKAMLLIPLSACIYGAAWLFPLFTPKSDNDTTLHEQIAMANKIAAAVRPHDKVFDPDGLTFLRPKPGPFHVFVSFLIDLHRDGLIDLNIPAMLAHENVNVVVVGRRLPRMGKSVMHPIRTDYLLTQNKENSTMRIAVKGRLLLNAVTTTATTTGGTTTLDYYVAQGGEFTTTYWLPNGEVELNKLTLPPNTTHTLTLPPTAIAAAISTVSAFSLAPLEELKKWTNPPDSRDLAPPITPRNNTAWYQQFITSINPAP